MLDISHTCGQDFYVPITSLIHLKNMGYQIHTVLPSVIESPNKRRNKDIAPLCAPGCCIHCGCLLLSKTEGHINPHSLFHCFLRCFQAFPGGRELDMPIWNP